MQDTIELLAIILGSVIAPILIVLAAVWLIIKSFGTSFKKGQIVEKWETLIEQGSRNANDIYEVINASLESARHPNIFWNRNEILASGALEGKNYSGLMVINSYLKDYRAYIFVYDYGTNLYIAWFLTFQKKLWRHTPHMDVVQQLELGSYIYTVHDAVKKAVRTLMERLGQDFSTVNTKSKGFLEIW